jgi:hypothetical protein
MNPSATIPFCRLDALDSHAMRQDSIGSTLAPSRFLAHRARLTAGNRYPLLCVRATGHHYPAKSCSIRAMPPGSPLPVSWVALAPGCYTGVLIPAKRHRPKQVFWSILLRASCFRRSRFGAGLGRTVAHQGALCDQSGFTRPFILAASYARRLFFSALVGGFDIMLCGRPKSDPFHVMGRRS